MPDQPMTPEQRAEFRRFVREHHPDVGGDPAAFTAGLARLRAAAGIGPEDPRSDGPVIFISNRRRRQEAILRILRKLERLRPTHRQRPGSPHRRVE